MKVRDIGFSSFKEFICCFVQYRSDIDSILNITCCVYCFCPKVFSQIVFMDHCSSNFLYRSIISFYNPILLWSSRKREFMNISIFFSKSFKWLIFKFSTMITPDFQNFQFFFTLYLSAEVTKHII